MCPIYQYKHPDTGEIFEEMRKIKDRNKPFISEDDKKCKRLEIPTSISGWKKNKEVFEADPAYVKKCKPKYVQFQDGHKEKYDPTKHC
jgi:hypothetical protein